MNDVIRRLAEYGLQLDELCPEVTTSEIEQQLLEEQEATMPTPTAISSTHRGGHGGFDGSSEVQAAEKPRRRRVLAVVAAAILVVLVGVIITQGGEDNSNVITDELPLEPTREQQESFSNPVTGIEIDETVVAMRADADTAEFDIEATGFEPGNAVTAWLFVIDHQACLELFSRGEIETRQQLCTSSLVSHPEIGNIGFLAGGLVSTDGVLTIEGTVNRSELQRQWFDTPLPSFEDALFHVRLKDHGPPIEGRVDEMISTYRGGCLGAEGAPAVAVADGTPGPNVCIERQKATLAPELP